MSNSDPAQFDREWSNAVFDYVTKGEDEREKAADRRNAELVRVNREGWKSVADAITKGLGGIADALRTRR